jgi:cytidylate kinase
MNDNKHYVITIGRTFGSGGRALGRLLADKLGIDYYDKELLVEAAKKSGLSREYFERNDERTPSFISGLIPFSLGFNPMAWYNDPSSISSDNIYKAQSDLIHELAERGSCVIVGRSADYVLRDVDNVVNIFVHAPIEHCVDRIVGRNECKSRAEAQALAEKTNKLRANYYNFYTDKRWGDAASYDLCFNSSLLPMEGMVEVIAKYIEKRLGFNPLVK